MDIRSYQMQTCVGSTYEHMYMTIVVVVTMMIMVMLVLLSPLLS